MGLSLIVARSEDNVIGYQNSMPWHVPEDLKFFKRVTTGHAIIMGRKTYESIGKPLPKRTNIVVSKSITKIDGCQVYSSLDEAIEAAKKVDPNPIVIGGASIYEQALPLVDKIYLTTIRGTYPGDTYFTLDSLNPNEWEEVERDAIASEDCIFHVFEKEPK